MRVFLFISICLLALNLRAGNSDTLYIVADTALAHTSDCLVQNADNPNPIFKKFNKKQRLNKKITAAVLAFPFPFGMVGLHRIYLGTKPHVPVVYIATFGGVLGILPLIDFFVITCDKNFDQYRDNGKIFMWIK